MPDSSDSTLRNKIGGWTSTSLVLGNMIGSGIFLLPASLAVYGGISIVGWVISSLGAILLAQVFASLSRIITSSGGPYVFTKSGLGNFAGFLVAWGYWISIWCTNAAITVAMLGYLAVFFPVLEQQPVIAIGTGLSIIWLLTWVNSNGVRNAGYVQLITTILKVIPLIVVTIAGFFFFQLDHFQPFNMSGVSSFEAIIQSTTLTLFAFLGIECATIPAEDVKDGSRIISKATWIGTILAIIVYVLSSISIMGVLPPGELQYSSAPFADAAKVMFGESASYWVAAGAVISTFGALNGWILMQGQIPMAAARDNIFPSFFSRINKAGAPASGIFLSSILVSVLMMTNYAKGLNKAFEFMILLSTLTVLVPYLFSAASYILLAAPNQKVSIRHWTAWIGLGAFCFSLFAVVGSGQEVVFWGFIMLMAGIPFYLFIKKEKTIDE